MPLPASQPAAHQPYPAAEDQPGDQDRNDVVLHVGEKGFQEVAEIVAGTADDRCPEKGAAEVQQHEAAGVEAAGADDDGGDGAHAVDEAEAEHGDDVVRDQEAADPVDLRFPAGTFCQQVPAVTLAELEEELVGAEGAAEDDADHPPQLHIAAVGEAAGDHADHSAFQQGADPEGRVAVGGDERFHAHATTLAQNRSRRLELAE